MGIFGLLILNCAEDLVFINLVHALEDDRIANFSDEHNKSRWRVVILREGPDKENGVHDSEEGFSDLRKLPAGVQKLVEETS